MLYSSMTPQQRHAVLDEPEVYPLRVTFLGKAAILTLEEIEFLRRSGVDFEVDEKQADRIIREAASGDASVLWGVSPVEPGPPSGDTLPATGGLLVGVIAAVTGIYGVLRFVARFLRRR